MEAFSKSQFNMVTPSMPEPPVVVSLFEVEKDLNIEFRRFLGDCHHDGTQITEVDPPIPSWSSYDCAADIEHVPSPRAEHDFDAPATITPSIPAARQSSISTPIDLPGTNLPPPTMSIDGTDTSSDTSSSPTAHNSPSSVFTSTSPASSSTSHTSPSSTNSPPQYSIYPNICSDCALAFRTNGQLNKHRNLKHIKRFSCREPQCTAAFHLTADLRRHVASVHADRYGTVRIECVVAGCRKSFTRSDNMARHLRTWHGIEGK
ncbi:hypothetical protein FB567DRAFT_95668 [Paraphoma chrysanthemicola]|uniref:C2H2-type domain-containing protein n=1 Tax=Paraphoma chrysanthemicola TaxID=798071 RepID=A0A8K0R436_9PLEO|nr:hypothetical protein FB567DRAFT_95668 [Paraphoma chrysanthemicola]